jgi:hypothetical protein
VDVSAWAAAIVAGLTVVLAVTGVAGYLFGKRTRAEDQAEKVGRLEGRIDGRRTDRSPQVTDENVFMIIGGLRSDVSNIVGDIREIRANQDANNSAARLAHDNLNRALSAVSSEVSQLKTQFTTLNRSVQSILRARRPRAGADKP